MNLFQYAHNSTSQILSDSEKLAWLRLIRTENIGPVTFYRLVERFGSADKALEVLPSLAKRGGHKKNGDIYPAASAEKEMRALEKIGGKMIFAGDEDYPLALAAIDDAPPVLSVLGNSRLLHTSGIGMVGARNASINGRRFAEILAKDLGKAGQIIISGLARGIDTAAHQGALESGTVAVVAGGIDIVYPEENKKLYEDIKERGCIIAESPLGQKPFAQSFPKRNRLISGLSSGIVVVEASLRSGSLITARMAGEQGRDVFAVPGFPIDPRAQGPNKLLQEGAVLVQSAEDILNHINSFAAASRPQGLKEAVDSSYDTLAYEEDEKIIGDAKEILMKQLSHMPVQMDEILRNSGLDIAAFNSALLHLEIAGQVARHSGGRIALLR